MSAVPTFLAVDIGATKLAVRVAGPAGTRQAAAAWPTGGVSVDLDHVRRLVGWARTEAGTAVARVGVASAPTIGADGVVAAWPSRPSWVGLPLLDLLAEVADAEVATADDGCLAAVAESVAAGCGDLAYLGLGTGVGGGLIVGGRLLRGTNGAAGQLGHLPIEADGPPCRCGRRGCLQAYLSGTALAAAASRVRGRATSTYDLAGAAAAGHGWAAQVIDEAAGVLARAVLVVAELADPARVHIGGGLGAALPMLPERVTATLAPMRRGGQFLPTIATTRLGGMESLGGAMLLAERPELLTRS